MVVCSEISIVRGLLGESVELAERSKRIDVIWALPLLDLVFRGRASLSP